MKIIVDQFEFNDFFKKNRERSLNFLHGHYSALSHNDIEDIYQESAMALITQIQTDRLKNLECSLYTYFLSICNNQALKALSKCSANLSLDDNWQMAYMGEEDVLDEKFAELEALVGYDIEDDTTKAIHLDEVEEKVRQCVQNMPAPCNQVLWSYYWEGLSHRTIAELYGWKSENVSKTNANRCKNKFSNYLKDILS